MQSKSFQNCRHDLPPNRRGTGLLSLAVVGLLSLGLGGCSLLGRAAVNGPGLKGAETAKDKAQLAQGTGFLEVRANGEDFVRQGFTSKDGWEIAFDHLYVSLAEVAALQTQPPFDPDSEQAPQVQRKAEQPLTPDAATGSSTTVVDLAAPEAATALVVQFPQAQAGRYNALGWSILPATTGPSAGQSLRLMGQASRGDEAIAFTLDWDASYRYLCGDFIGDQRKGILKDGDRADLEATFHFDHVFGDGDTPQGDALNEAALGFAPLAAIAQDGQLTATRAALQTQLAPDDFQRLDEAMAGLAHVGEGHCRQVSLQSSRSLGEALAIEVTP